MTEAARHALRARLATELPGRWRTRFAPAPTGYLHLGHALNAVYVWSIARAFGGDVLLRIEDHDRQRSRAHYEQAILDDLAWLGLTWDNARTSHPDPIRQSDRGKAYEHALAALAQSRGVYACRCSRRVIASHGLRAGEQWYSGTCRNADVPFAETPARRLRLTDAAVRFDDLRHGRITQVPADQCGDLLLRDRLGQWTYQFAVVVDDIECGTSVIIRGDDLLASTGRQILLSEQLGHVASPVVVHHPLVVHPDGTKLSKSNGDTALHELRALGWTAERVLGHAAWLGGLTAADAELGPDDLALLWLSSR